jgi:hypothetical protein
MNVMAAFHLQFQSSEILFLLAHAASKLGDFNLFGVVPCVQVCSL